MHRKCALRVRVHIYVRILRQDKLDPVQLYSYIQIYYFSYDQRDKKTVEWLVCLISDLSYGLIFVFLLVESNVTMEQLKMLFMRLSLLIDKFIGHTFKVKKNNPW